jgi:fibronectin type 3 domain-containing protein
MPSTFAATMEGLREDYPPAAWDALHNLVDSHDTTRILWTLTPGDDNREAKESVEALAIGKARLRVLAALQLTWPGMSGVYYGTEAGITGHDDPDDRRPYPWSAIDAELFDWYATLGQLRADREVLRTGDLTFLLADDEAGTLAFGRRTDAEAAITVLNLTDAPRTVTVPTSGWIPEGVALADALGGATVTTAADGVTLDLPGYGAAVLLTDAGVDLAAPDAPADLGAEGSTGRVALSWSAVEDAASYRVWRSVLSGGGYRMVGTVEDATSFEDRSVRNGTRVHYVVTAVDAAGNESERSPEATALPELVVAEARLTGDGAIEQQIAALEAGEAIEATVNAPPYSDLDGATVGIRMELGFGPDAESVTAEDDGWTWAPMTYDGEDGEGDRWTGSVRPEETGTYRVAARLSTDGGATWRAVGTGGIREAVEGRRLVAVAADDTSPPSAPEGLVATSVAETGVSLAWEAVTDGDLHRYEILRARDGGELERIGVATETAFTDDSVSGGQTYRYAVRAQDTSFNRSEPSAAIEVGATARDVTVTFTVSVPPHTTATDSVFIAGDFQGWDPGATPMTRVDDTTWEITIGFPEATPLQYKYTRGSWEAVEKDAGCGEIPNRELTVQHGTEGVLVQADEVAKWRDLDNCP